MRLFVFLALVAWCLARGDYNNDGPTPTQLLAMRYMEEQSVIALASPIRFVTAHSAKQSVDLRRSIAGSFEETLMPSVYTSRSVTCSVNNVTINNQTQFEVCYPFLDCNNNTRRDQCDIDCGFSLDCQNNTIPDECDISSGNSLDQDEDGVPDECQEYVCGDNICETPETCISCPSDCGVCCGNGLCQPEFNETCFSCAGDCGVCCGDGNCTTEFGENATTCAQDCHTCGDGLCTDGYENITTCAQDCFVCGDEICTSTYENVTTCPQDCNVCGDDLCTDVYENVNTCPQDCFVCGDNLCTDGYENATTCPGDCVSCGDGICSDGYENCYDCEEDCGACCGDGICDAAYEETCITCEADCFSCCGDFLCEAAHNETCDTCPDDCGGCCGNFICEPVAHTEDCLNCPADCTTCCGDGVCSPSIENCTLCDEDCGVCPITCGDGICNGNETCDSCELDCGACCGDGMCNSTYGEDCVTCASDCGICCGNGVCQSSLGENCTTCDSDCGICCGNGVCDISANETCNNCVADCGNCCPTVQDETLTIIDDHNHYFDPLSNDSGYNSSSLTKPIPYGILVNGTCEPDVNPPSWWSFNTWEIPANQTAFDDKCIVYTLCNGTCCSNGTMTVVYTPIMHCEDIPDVRYYHLNVISAESLTENPEGGSVNYTIYTFPQYAAYNLTNATIGEITFIPYDNATTDSFGFEACNQNRCITCNLTLEYSTPPLCHDDIVTVYYPDSLSFNVLDNDSDPDNLFDPFHSNVSLVTSGNTSFVINSTTGEVTYTPVYPPWIEYYNPNATDEDHYGLYDETDYIVCDSDDGRCSTCTIKVTLVYPIQCLDDDIVVYYAQNTSIDILGNDDDFDQPLYRNWTLTITDPPTNGTIVFNEDKDTNYYTTAISGTDTFTYTIEDPDGYNATCNVNVTYLALPVCVTQYFNVSQNSNATVFNLTGLGSDPDQEIRNSTLRVEIPNFTSMNGNVTLVGSPAYGIAYIPAEDYAGHDIFTYNLCDSDDGCVSCTIDVAVVIPPTCGADHFSIPVSGSGILTILDNDADPDTNTTDLVITILTQNITGALNLTITENNTLYFVAEPNYAPNIAFNYSLCDDYNLCVQCPVSLDIYAPPVCSNILASVNSSQIININVLQYVTDSDNDTDPTSLNLPSQPSIGTPVANANGTITYMATSSCYLESYIYEICDTRNLCDQCQLNITVVCLATTQTVTTTVATTQAVTTQAVTTRAVTTQSVTTQAVSTGAATTNMLTTAVVTTADSTTGDATTGEATTGEATTGDITTGEVTTGNATTTGPEPEVNITDDGEGTIITMSALSLTMIMACFCLLCWRRIRIAQKKPNAGEPHQTRHLATTDQRRVYDYGVMVGTESVAPLLRGLKGQ